ncbi:hypothetical protein [Streptomyces sp. 2P-4]|uniref:hypothetical protein n=1 Tax=Streptomyces sp. 2P-4 TaxID=2931974 RepID=UPI002540D6E5|nr:hypothetical protein [Streptomyces sp. 2P-4]
MNGILEFQMQDAEGGMIGFDSVLAWVPDNGWVWSVLEFDGILQAMAGLGYREFLQRVASSPQGCVMSWDQLQDFAASVQQCFDLLLVAVKDRCLLDPGKFAAGDFAECLLVLTASDSTWWTVRIDPAVEEVSALAVRLQSEYGGKAG